MPSSVRVTNNASNGGGDSHAAGRARLKLKLSAIAYVNARHGVDADAGLSRAGIKLLLSAAVEYYKVLMPASVNLRIGLDGNSEQLKLAAIAYVNARHGIDADAGLSRVGLALLCAMAIEYCEAITGADPRNRPIDPQIHQLNGES